MKKNKIIGQTKKKIKINKIIIALLLIAIIIYAVTMICKLLGNPTDTCIVSNGSLSSEETVEGYIIREETVIEGENHRDGTIKIKSEGERVAKGDAVFRYYSSTEIEIKENIAKLDEKIQKALENENMIFTSDKKLLETQIEEELNNIYNKNNIQKIQEYKKNINAYITKKAKIVGELSPSGSYLKSLIEERSSYEQQLEKASEYVNSPISGMVSYKIDRLENVLTTTDLGKFDKEFLEKLNLKTGQSISSNETTGKIINNYNCYIIFNSNTDEAKNAEINDKITIKLQNSVQVTTKITNIIEEYDGSRTIAIKLKNETEELSSYRKILFDIIWWKATGYRIPNTAIKEIDGVSYVIRNRNGYLNKMAVKILKQNEKYAIVDTYTRSELIALGITSKEISNLKTLTLYDEILKEPTEQQLLQ